MSAPTSSNNGEVVVWLGSTGKSPLTAAFEQLQGELTKEGFKDPAQAIQKSEPVDLCVADMGHSSLEGADVTGIQATASFTWKTRPSGSRVVWEVRWDADDIKGEHVNLKVTPAGQRKRSWAFCSSFEVKEEAKEPVPAKGKPAGKAKEAAKGDGDWNKYWTRITYYDSNNKQQVIHRGEKAPAGAHDFVAHKPPSTLQAMTDLTQRSGYALTEMKKARDPLAYRKERAREILRYWCLNILEREQPKWDIHSAGKASTLPEPRP